MSNFRANILRRPSNLLLLAAGLHVLLTAGIYAAGRLAIIPTIDTNGCATSVSPDSGAALIESNWSADKFNQSGPVTWAKMGAKLHVKVYSVSLIILRPFFGANILTVEPVNLLCYLFILVLTFKLSKEVFDRRVAFAATAAVALWPSFLLHTTQLLKDQFFIASLLLLVLIMTYWLTRILSWRLAVATGITGGLAAYAISLTRSEFWAAIVFGIVCIGVGVLVVRQIWEKQILLGNVLSAALVLCTAGMSILIAPVSFQQPPVPAPTAAATPVSSSLSLRQRLDGVAKQLSVLRRQMWFTRHAGSDIDAHVEFAGVADVARYLPRAVVIGFLAPFPNRWIASGNRVGRAGQLLSGLEMCVMYFVEILALIGLWRSRSSLAAWLLFFVSLAGVLAVTLVMINLGALYRMRYGFFFLLLILGARGLVTLVPNRSVAAVADAGSGGGPTLFSVAPEKS